MFHMCVWYPQRSGEGAGCPAVGVTDQLCPDNEHCSRFCSYCCYRILSSWIHSQQFNCEHRHWEVNRLTTGQHLLPAYYYQCWGKRPHHIRHNEAVPFTAFLPWEMLKDTKQKACAFPQVLAHKWGPGREQRMLGTATKGPVNKVTKKRVWYQ